MRERISYEEPCVVAAISTDVSEAISRAQDKATSVLQFLTEMAEYVDGYDTPEEADAKGDGSILRRARTLERTVFDIQTIADRIARGLGTNER